MKKGLMIISIFLLALLMFGSIAAVFIWGSNHRLRFVKQLGNGFNLGNALDSTGMWDTNPERPELAYETYWDNPEINSVQLRAIREAGLNSVRIPVTWEDHIDENGVISETWMQRVVEVVDMALAEDLYVVLNTQHEEWLNLEIEREEEISELYRMIWTQIAERFAEYDERLIFEGMNEPRLRDSENEWDGGTYELRAMVNRLNQIFVDTVRASGSQNKMRFLMVPAYATSIETEALEDLVVPKGNVIVSVHMYIPHSFCQDEDGTAEWSSSNPNNTRPIENAFEDLKRLFTDRKIPVVITEFGCTDKNNTRARADLIGFYIKTAGDYGIPCILWDNGDEYKFLDRESGEWIYPEILDALTGK